MVKYILIGLGVLLVLGLVGGCTAYVWPGWAKSQAAPAFDVASCTAYDPATGRLLDKDESKKQNKCVYPAPATFDITKCTAFDPSSGNPLDKAESEKQGKCTYTKPIPTAPTAIPTAVTTAVPTAPVQPTVPASSGAVSCKTDSDVMALFGFTANEIIRTDAPWDSCKWNRQNLPSTISFQLKDGWGLTYTDPQGNVWVTIGKGQQITARGFTLRQPGNQFLALGPTGYFNKEWDFGFAPERGTNKYVHCPDENIASLVTLTTEQAQKCAGQGTKPASAGALVVTPSITGSGPTDPAFSWNTKCFDTAWLSSNIGGSTSNWTKPDWDGGAAVYKLKGTLVPLQYPGFGKLVVWIGSGPVEITATNAAQLTGKTFDEASFHCQ